LAFQAGRIALPPCGCQRTRFFSRVSRAQLIRTMENPVLRIKTLRWVGGLIFFCAFGISSAIGQTFTRLVAFDGANGGDMTQTLVQGVDGRLYGTTEYGSPVQEGTAFALGRTGLGVLHSFCLQPPCTDGSLPTGALLLATDGYFYGTTRSGGACDCGTIFKIDRRGKTFSTLHDFKGTDGSQPLSPLIQAVDGFFYGTTVEGGAANLGTIFKMSSNGALVVLHSFDGTDGQYPFAGLLQATDGNFYGTTDNGGSGLGSGTVFKMAQSGTFTVLHSFCTQFGCTDGAFPLSALTQGADGRLYGTTQEGGEYEDGTVFGITTNGMLTTLYNFCALPNCADGQGPVAGVTLGSDGNFYGTTEYGGANEAGAVFGITPAGKLTTLYSFCSKNECLDGRYASGGVTQGTDGNFYGSTIFGGDLDCPLNDGDGCGTIFKLETGLGPFVTFGRAAGKVGQTGGILGQGFTGTTSVSLNGTPASFTVVSDTFIKATVPVGATTGYVTVTTPSGTLTSNVPFHVLP
jgi:uncharacterized repeat protein (TIGR03803 family)